jgi:hypothetical protein
MTCTRINAVEGAGGFSALPPHERPRIRTLESPTGSDPIIIQDRHGPRREMRSVLVHDTVPMIWCILWDKRLSIQCTVDTAICTNTSLRVRCRGFPYRRWIHGAGYGGSADEDKISPSSLSRPHWLHRNLQHIHFPTTPVCCANAC